MRLVYARTSWNWAVIAGIGLAAALIFGHSAKAAGPIWPHVELAGGEEDEFGADVDNGIELRRLPPRRDTPSEDGTDDPSAKDAAPDTPSGCIFKNGPLELIV